ncbi:MAG: hypothetical protein KF689_13015 [Gemmatimonadaceae bacterium]|nr:hypothetical protein [Gemmatimonadaceae bacterium]MCW5827095.1 hypothetical protein [Gemmatimonadaceae bacterium]
MISERQRTLLLAAQHTWSDATAHLSAYERRLHREARRSAALRWTTVILGIVTGAAAAGLDWKWVTVSAALVTSTLAAIQQQFSPAEMLRKFWECMSELKEVKGTLESYALSVASELDFDGGDAPIRQASTRMLQAMREPIVVEPADRAFAEEAFRQSLIAVLLARATAAAPLAESEGRDALPQSVPGMIPVVRVRAS